MWRGWEQAPKTGLSSLQLQRTTKIQFFPLAFPFMHMQNWWKMYSFNTEKPKIIFHFISFSCAFTHRANTPSTAHSSLIMTAVNKVLSTETSLLKAHSGSGVRDLFLWRQAQWSPWEKLQPAQPSPADYQGLLTQERAEIPKSLPGFQNPSNFHQAQISLLGEGGKELSLSSQVLHVPCPWPGTLFWETAELNLCLWAAAEKKKKLNIAISQIQLLSLHPKTHFTAPSQIGTQCKKKTLSQERQESIRHNIIF